MAAAPPASAPAPTSGRLTIAQSLSIALDLGLDRLDSQLLLLHALGRSAHDRAWLMAHDTDALDDASSDSFTRLVRRRLNGEPVAYLVGRKEFF